jgi:hypothetical protein
MTSSGGLASSLVSQPPLSLSNISTNLASSYGATAVSLGAQSSGTTSYSATTTHNLSPLPIRANQISTMPPLCQVLRICYSNLIWSLFLLLLLLFLILLLFFTFLLFSLIFSCLYLSLFYFYVYSMPVYIYEYIFPCCFLLYVLLNWSLLLLYYFHALTKHLWNILININFIFRRLFCVRFRICAVRS